MIPPLLTDFLVYAQYDRNNILKRIYLIFSAFPCSFSPVLSSACLGRVLGLLQESHEKKGRVNVPQRN